jgi:MFS family permease
LWGWQATMLAFGLISAAVIIPVALLVLQPPPAQVEAASTAASRAAERQVLGLPPNLVQAGLCAAAFLCCIPMAMPASHLVAFCGDIGIPASRGALMLSVTMLCAFVARQAWGALGDRIGGVNTALAGNVLQTIGMALFLVTQDEAGLFLVAALYGLGFGGIIPSYVLGIRALFPARQAHWRVPVLIFCGLAGMATGSWLAGVMYDATGSYGAAWQAGIVANLVNLAILVPLALRWRGWHRPQPALA